jgi:bifunctional non-homologous end joining protein LigD
MPNPAQRQSDVQIAGIPLSNAERILYPEQGISKRQLAEYYEIAADHILPHVVGRPLSLVRCPRGREGTCFFQRHLNGEAPEGLQRIAISGTDGTREEYLVVRDLAGLVSLAQLGVLELHPWGATVDNPGRPDRLVLDLDPGEGAVWEDVVHGARWLHKRLAGLGLQNFVRTTGGKGLHVVVPIVPTRDWDTVKAFARGIAHEMADQDPRRYVDTASKSKRVGKVFVDYLRNARGASSIASYSPRARRNAPVATPLHWPELAQLTGADIFTIKNIPDRLDAMREDPWAGFSELRQELSDEALRQVPTVADQ